MAAPHRAGRLYGEAWWTIPAVGLVAMALALLPLEHAVAATVFVAALVAGLKDPVWLLVLVAFAVPFGSEVRLQTGGLGGATDLAIAGALGAWGVRFLTQPRARLWLPTPWLAIPGFVGLLLLSTTMAPQVVPGAAETLKWLQFGLLAMAAAHTMQDAGRRWILVVAVLTAASFEGAVGWYQFLTGTGPEAFFLSGGLLRAYGTFGQPNPFAGYLALVLPLIVSLALGQPGHFRLPRLRATLGLACAGVLVGGGLVFSFSRGGWIAAGGALAVVMALHSRRVRAAFLLAGPLLAVLVLAGALDVLPPQVVDRFQIVTRYVSLFDARRAVLTPENYAIVERMAIWQAAGAMFSDRPLLGVGAGNFDVAYPSYALRGWPNPPGHAHNAYLTMLAEMGLLGAAAHGLVLAGLLLMAAQALRRFRQGGAPPDAYPLALGVMGMLVALSVHNLLDNLYVHGILAHVGLMVGVMAAPLLAERQPRALAL